MNTPLASTFDTRLLGGLSPAQFLRDYWQKKPLLIRQAVPGFNGLLPRDALLALSARDDVESRFVAHDARDWTLESGPLPSRLLKRSRRSAWTVLVQGLNLLLPQAEALMRRFDFIPYARLDDVMVSYATDGGGVGPHFDNYDVFLLQGSGRRHWQISTQDDLTLIDGAPLKILKHFVPEQAWTLEPGDMLYLPPRWAHDGIAEGECMTYSIGFRSPNGAQLAHEVLQRMAEAAADEEGAIYRDPQQPAVAGPGAIPAGLQEFARKAVQRALEQPQALECALGEALTEPKPNVWFEPAQAGVMLESVALDRRTRMMYDDKHVFINGESYRAAGRDAALMRQLADERRLGARELARASDAALELLSTWCEAGWVHAGPAV